MAGKDVELAAQQPADKTEEWMSVARFQQGLLHVVQANEHIQAHPSFRAAQQVRAVATLLHEPIDPHATRLYMEAMASCMTHEPWMQQILQHMRPFVLDFVLRLMDPSLAVYDVSAAGDITLCEDTMMRYEIVAAALTLLLELLPQHVTLVKQFLAESPCFLDYLSVATSAKTPSAAALARMQRTTRTAYRLLRVSPDEFIPLWNWSSLFSLSFADDVTTRWYAARATALVLRMGNAHRTTFLRELQVDDEATARAQPNTGVRSVDLHEYKHEVELQEQRLRSSTTAEHNTGADQPYASIPFHESLRNIFGVVVPARRVEGEQIDDTAAQTQTLVATPSTKINLQSIAIALGLKRPVLVSGGSGCGKTAVIRELARLTGNSDLVELHLDDQIDSKTLLGSYVCTDIPGEFTWQPGALTTAILEGRWVVVEDIDRAPFEVLAALMPLLETREMVLPGRGEVLAAHSNFQIFATTTHGHLMPKGFQESIWTNVDLRTLPDEEIQQVLETKYQKIPKHLIAKIMTTFNMVSGHLSSQEALLWKETRRNYGRDFGLRDLLKWCKRIYSFCYTGSTNTQDADRGSTYVTEEERLRIIVEAFDVFCAGIRDPNTRMRAALAIGSVWEVTEEKIRYTMAQHKPSVKFSNREVEIGRVHLPTLTNNHVGGPSSFVMTGHVLRLLEQLAAIVHTCEPALLIGETGCGKTTVIQHLAASLGQTLVVQNLNIQSDSSDLVGGFKPVEIHLLARPLYMTFVDLFTLTFSQKSNAGFLNMVRIAFEHKEWKKMAKGLKKAVIMANKKLNGGDDGDSSKMATKGSSPNALSARWDEFEADVVRFERQREQVESHFAFAFVEGVLVKALREGHWVLLDEINLASSDTLERISTLLEHETSAFSITERGDVEIIRPHPNFRLFGAMNPSTDVGKKDLPPSLRNRFTEIYVDECVCPSDLQMVVEHHFKQIASAPVVETVQFYLEARKQADERLSDGARHKPRYSLRTLSQALHITRILIQRGYGTPRALYEGFSSSFCTCLDLDSRQYLEKLIKNTFAKTMKARDLTRAPPRPGGKSESEDFVLVSSYWVKKGGYMEPRDEAIADKVTNRKKFVLTKSVEENLRHLARAALISKYPVLLQGPTSAGKTSLISYLAARIGQKCVRINNHEHTDIQEYLGSYVSDSNGKLTFKEGVLVEAVRNGWWIILDELNLAPSEVLEALNRLLDDNRELFLPETQETVRPHPKFMLFATQNPPGLYGGRKVLSRAFRNRFLEIQVDEAPSSELQTIIQERSSLPPSYCVILIEVMRQLQLVRQQSSIFAGKGGFITTRDLLRWAERRPMTKQALAEEGYCLLAERLRKDEEKEIVKEVLEKKCNVTIDLHALYYTGEVRESTLLNENGEVEHEVAWGTNEQFKRVQQMVEEAAELAARGEKLEGNAAGLEKISITKSLRRLFSLVGRCLQNEEPVLLVGETGCGKTTVCQLYSLLFNQPLHILNCHQHTETSDFLGCLRPVRGKEKIAGDLLQALQQLFEAAQLEVNVIQRTDLACFLVLFEAKRSTLEKLASESDDLRKHFGRVCELKRRHQAIFEWCDGPLVESMKKGDLILIDEVNLAEDAVLERLNSVLEPSRTLLLAEKGGDHVEEIVAHKKWRVMATMNPGGDFGKRELSPALRNRFTEIWVPSITDIDDIATIVRDRLAGRAASIGSRQIDLAPLCDPTLAFVQQFNKENGGFGGCGAVTLRDILSWINFICTVTKEHASAASLTKVGPWTAFVQGAALAILDGLGLGSDKALHTALKARDSAYKYLLDLVPTDDEDARREVLESLSATKNAVGDKIGSLNSKDEKFFGLSPFMITRGSEPVLKRPAFSLKAPTTMSNLYRVLRAMQVNRPIILEGSPGVGKTSLISALAAASGHRLVRINLSEQTDISDLFGSDLPAASGGEGNASSADKSNSMFEWCDGVFLRALKAGDWVLLDELNLASQSVLEGLNSCLDHRGSVYIPELDREFECPQTFRVFAAQNPLRQGGGRKGLPKSFLNRFTRVFVDVLQEEDLVHIASSIYPTLSNSALEGKSLIEKMLAFNSTVHEDTMVNCTYGRLGAPWEFNLRDVFRFCELLKTQNVSTPQEEQLALSYFVNFIYVERMRCQRDRDMISQRFEEFFGFKPMDLSAVAVKMSEHHVQVGNAFIKRQDVSTVSRITPPVFNFLLRPMEALVHCVNMSWPALLIGPPASGKTSSVRLLAALTGFKLHELGMSAGTDATELLGCFEQVDVGRKLRDVRHRIGRIQEQFVRDLLARSAGATKKERSTMMKEVRRLNSTWWALVQREHDMSENKTTKKRAKRIAKGQLDDVTVQLLDELVSAMKHAFEKLNVALWADDLKRLEVEMGEIVKLSNSTNIASCFEWVDGTLIQAMERGEWVLLDNVNFCSSSVLDRLNALMETGGELLVNECGVINGQLRVIKPHPNFRIFLAMDAQFGEVSRAMRNRCVEISLVEQDERTIDLVTVANTCGIPGFSICNAFQKVHKQIVAVAAENLAGKHARLNRRHLQNWCLMTSREVSRGMSIENAAITSLGRIYGEELIELLQLNDFVRATIAQALETTESSLSKQRALPVLASPYDTCVDASGYTMKRASSYFQFLFAGALDNDDRDALLVCLGITNTNQNEVDCLSEALVQRARGKLVRFTDSLLLEARELLWSKDFLPSNGLSVTLLPTALRRLFEICCVIKPDATASAGELLLLLLERISSVAAPESTPILEFVGRFANSAIMNELLVGTLEKLHEVVKRVTSKTDVRAIGGIPAFADSNLVAGRASRLLLQGDAESLVEIEQLQTRADLLEAQVWLSFCETEIYREVDALCRTSNNSEKKHKRQKRETISDISSLGVLQQSYAVHRYGAERSAVDNEVVFMIYPFLDAFDNFVASALGHIGDTETSKLVCDALRHRYEFSIQMRSSTFDWSAFLIHWRWLAKSISSLESKISSDASVQTAWNKLSDVSERLQETIVKVVGCESRKMTLWKHGGHALLPLSAESWSAQNQLENMAKTFMEANQSFIGLESGSADNAVDVLSLLYGGVASMEAAMKSGQLDVSSLFYVDTAMRREVLHALCAFSYLIQYQRNRRHGGERQQSEMSVDQVLKVPSLLLKKIQEKKVDVSNVIAKSTLYLSEIEDVGQSHVDLLDEEDSRIGKDVPVLLFSMEESGKLMHDLVKFQLSAMIEHDLARDEVGVIAQLMQLINVYHLDSSKVSTKLVSSTLAELESLLDGIVELGLRTPASYFAYQDIVWNGHHFLDEADSDDVDVKHLSEFMELLQSHINGILHGFHEFLRRNSFNQADVVAYEIFDAKKKLVKAIKGKKDGKVSIDEEEQVHVVFGFPRLFQCVDASVMLKSISEVELEDSHCSTIETQVRSLRLEKMKQHLASRVHRHSDEFVKSVTGYWKEMFVATIVAFRSTYDDKTWVALQALLTTFRDSAKLDSSAQTQLVRLLKSSTDEFFVSLVDELARPLIALSVTDDDFAFKLGDALIRLGLIRFALLIPSSPVDPVTKPLIKKESLMNRLTMLAMDEVVNDAVANVDPLPQEKESTSNELNVLAKTVADISAFAIQRFDPASRNEDGSIAAASRSAFTELFRDLLRFHNTLMPQRKILSFLATTKSSIGSEQNCRMLLRELDMFQQTTESFLMQMEKKYGGIFRDVLEPAASAVYVVKEGIAMLMWHIHLRLQEQKFARKEKEALALTLVQYPHVRSTSSEFDKQLFLGLQNLLHHVGSKSTQLIFGAKNKKKSDLALLEVALAKVEFLFRQSLAICAAGGTSTKQDALTSSKAIFELFLLKWQEQKEREEQKKREEEELFKYKVRNLEIETEEQLLEQEYRNQFPDYTASDFQAFVGQDVSNALLGAAATVSDADVVMTDKTIQRLCMVHQKLYAAAGSSRVEISSQELVDAFSRSFTLAVSMRKAINALHSTRVEAAVLSSGIFAASLVQSKLGSGDKSAVPSMGALSAEYIRGIDFHRDPFVKEVALVAKPLQNLLIKVQGLLDRWPDHAILQQLVLISDRIRNFEINSPLARTLTGVELLLRKAQEWEAYAAKAYSIADELSALSSLVTRWRKLELYSWPHLLYVKEKQHRLNAQKTWFSMYSLITGQFGDADTHEALLDSSSKPELKWLHLNDLSSWIFNSGDKAKSESKIAMGAWMSKLFETLDAYVRSCPMGQYEDRLMIVYSFSCQMFMEFWGLPDSAFESSKTRYALANVLYHLYRFYAQHLMHVDRQWSGLKAPIQRKLIEFVKICRWDEQTYYSLAESAEKSHRKLMKYVRDYDDVLTVPVQTVIDTHTGNGISKEGGFVGILATKTELEQYEDGVVVPELPKKMDEEGSGEEEAEAEVEENVPEKSLPPLVLSQPLISKRKIEDVDSELLQRSSWADKVPTLTRKVEKFAKQSILSSKSVGIRQKPREICENLCETIFYRMAILQKSTSLPKGAKKKALIDLLAELKAQGLLYFRLNLPSEQQQMECLFELDAPDVENCIQIDGMQAMVQTEESVKLNAKGKPRKSKKSKKVKSKEVEAVDEASMTVEKDSPMWLWKRADQYYYRFLNQISALRFSAMTQFSHDLSTSEVDRMNGYAENMLYTMLQHRQLLHATSISHEKLVLCLEQLQHMSEFKRNVLDNASAPSLSSLSTMTEWQQFQKNAALALRASIGELEILVNEVARSSSASATLPSDMGVRFKAIYSLISKVSDVLKPSCSISRSLGVPSIPYQPLTSTARESADVDADPISFAQPKLRVHGVSPAAAVECPELSLPAERDILLSNSTAFTEIEGVLRELMDQFSEIAMPDCFHDILSELSRICSRNEEFAVTNSAPAAASVSGFASESVAAFVDQFDKLVETVLVSIQDINKLSEAALSEQNPAEDATEYSEEATLRNQLVLLSSTLKDSRVNQIASQFACVLALLREQYDAMITSRSAEWRAAFVSCLNLMEAFEPNVAHVRAVSRQILYDFLVAHKSVMKLDFVLIRIFRNLFQHGFCRANDEGKDNEGESGGDGKMQLQDDVDGTGMGEGEGKKDVSHEIEDEEQLLGLKGEEQKEQQDQGNEPQDTGMEMQNDFEGTMQDVPDEEERDDDENDDEEEELDREMGDFDQEDENVVDEKMWGDDSDDDEDNIDKEKEKFEENSRMDQSEAIEDEIRGKDGDKDNEKEKESKEDENDKADKSNDPSNGGDDDDQDDQEDDNKQDPVNDDLEDNYEEKHDNVDPNDREGEDEGEQEGDELPEDIKLDKDEDMGDGDDGGEDVDAENADNEEEEAADVEDESLETGEKDDDEEEKQEDEDEDAVDSAVQMGAGGLDDENEEAEQEEEDDDPMQQEEVQPQENTSTAVAGTQSAEGQDQLESDNEQDEAEKDRDADESADDQNQNQNSSRQNSASAGEDEKQEWKPRSQMNDAAQQEEKRRDRRRQEPNPYRNPQEMQEHWKKRVEMIERGDKDEDNDKPRSSEKKEEMTTAEFVDDDEEMEDAEHALAAADENQMLNQNKANDEEEEDESMKEEDEPNADAANAMDVDDESTEQKEEEEESKDKVKEEKKPMKQDSAEREHDVDANMFDAEKESPEEKKSDAEVRQNEKDVDVSDIDEDENNNSKPVHAPQFEQSKIQHDDEEEDLSNQPEPKLLSADEVDALRDELDTFIANWSKNDSEMMARGGDLWSKYTAITSSASQRLCEQLRLVLEPMLRAKLEGDFRTGKRINMRKVIPYIASQFRKDKIWMRRTRPSKRQYQVMIAIDDSESMADNHAGRLALEAMTTLCKGMTQLEVGEISIVKFGQDIKLLHAFDAPFTDDAGSRVIAQFGFQQKRTNMIQTLDAILQVLDNAKNSSTASGASGVEFTQIVFLISDGRFDTDGRMRIKKLIETALEQQQLIVLLIVDQADNKDNSILETKSVTFNKGKVEMVPYLENYPFPYYVLLPTSSLLPEILSDSLRQWFEMLQMKQ
ncbi:TPA: hypothetical protein N0F65_006891 [Lagenidium giganteum]|uniref:Midasin n=1 Tax=Lagenidium giganteum TaxID=4803 RepID=A0AAV2ZJV4_9STRA|nr:TPA: hypothetical protein N0F65_006891 [Lagenidium giganteum]